jgi:hypothetical protein
MIELALPRKAGMARGLAYGNQQMGPKAPDFLADCRWELTAPPY